MTTVLDDLRLGARTLRRHARAYAAPFLMLTIGLAAATTMFSIVSAVLLDPLPYAHADRLSLVWDRVGESTRDVWLSPPEFADLRERARAFSELAAMTDRRYTLTNRSTPEELQAVAASPNLFELLGTQPRAGRLFRSGDDIHGSGFVTVLASPLAERLFGSAAAAVGQIVTLDGQGWTVVGVLPRAFSIWPPSSVFPKRVDLWVPIDSETYTRAGRNQNFLHVLARIRDGVTFEAAATDLTRVSSAINDEHPEQYKNRRWRMALVDFRQQLVGPSRPALLILFGSVGLLVLVACANVANLLLAHAASRTQEMAVRAALGASRARLLRQVLTESALLGLVATFAGIIAASWAVAWAAHSGPADVPRLAAASIDARTLVFSGCLALVTSLVFGAAPAWQLSHSSTADGLKEGLRGSTSGPRTRRYRSAFVIGELAIAVGTDDRNRAARQGIRRIDSGEHGISRRCGRDRASTATRQLVSKPRDPCGLFSSACGSTRCALGCHGRGRRYAIANEWRVSRQHLRSVRRQIPGLRSRDPGGSPRCDSAVFRHAGNQAGGRPRVRRS